MRTVVLFAATAAAFGQTPTPTEVPIAEAVALAAARYPAVRVSQEQLAAAAAGIQLARTAYLPRVDGVAQLNRATRNNVFGLVFPQQVLPPISGPVLGTNNLTNVWGSALGALVSWEPFDFGLRQANVAVSEAAQKRADAGLRRTRFEVASLAADAYLTLLAARETVKAAQAGVDRARAVEQVIGAVVRAELRPGADLARAEAERALAETQFINARQAVDIAAVTLAQFTGSSIAPVGLPQIADLTPAPIESHPRLLEQSTVIDEVKARQHTLDRSYLPRFTLQASLFARGSGANPDGTTGGAFSGFGPNIQNWALGFSVSFPVMELPSIRARKQIEVHNERAEIARREQLITDLNAQAARARAALDGALAVARNTPIQLRAAQAARDQATARYKAGVSSVTEVAEAERLLTQAEIDDALARLNIWRAQLAVAAASGDLDSFLASTRR
jgi:outer membrane protein TolC